MLGNAYGLSENSPGDDLIAGGSCQGTWVPVEGVGVRRQEVLEGEHRCQVFFVTYKPKASWIVMQGEYRIQRWVFGLQEKFCTARYITK